MAPQSYANHKIRIKGMKSPPMKQGHFRVGDVVFAEGVPFEGNAGSKSRPIAVLGFRGNQVLYAKCTTSVASRTTLLPVGDPISAGLGKDTYIEPVAKYMDASKLRYCLGHLSEEDMENLMEHIAR